MDFNKLLKSFDCPVHPGEKILRVAREGQTRKRLYCVECIIELEKTGRKNLISFDKLIDEIYSYLTQVEEIKSRTKPPEDLVAILYDEESLFAKITNQIHSQKMKVSAEIKKIEETFLKHLEKTKEKIAATLDNQFETFKKIYGEFKENMRRYFNYDNYRRRLASKQELCDDMNMCRTSADLEIKLNILFSEVEEIKRCLDDLRRGAIPVAIQNLKTQKAQLATTINNFPESNASSEKYFRNEHQVLLNYFHDFLTHLMNFSNSPGIKTNLDKYQGSGYSERYCPPEKYLPPENSHPQLETSPTKRDFSNLDSRVINAQDLRALGDWVGDRITNTRLLYRATQDGFELNKILNFFNPKSSVMIVIRTTNNEVIGCYRDRPRNPSLTEKFNKYFTFSLNDRKKVDDEYAFADLSAFDIGNCFISNSLFLVNNSHVSEGSYCILQDTPNKAIMRHSFDFENKAINYFMSQEIEIYQLDFERYNASSIDAKGMRSSLPMQGQPDYYPDEYQFNF